jgi:hypothetical protein
MTHQPKRSASSLSMMEAAAQQLRAKTRCDSLQPSLRRNVFV